ncbi:MAG: hypothetical protein WBD40_17005 [Tepidisphaeraceae bacterium]
MNTQPTEELVATQPAGDAKDEFVIQDDLPCRCGFNLRGLSESGRCPECGREVAVVLGDYEQAALDGRARRRLGASLLIANHVVWLCLLASWLVGVRGVPRSVIALLAAAGPRSVTSIEVFKPGTVRVFATSVVMLTLLNVGGIWMLTTVRRFEQLDAVRKAGWLLRCGQLAAVAWGAWLIGTAIFTNRSLLITLHLLEAPVSILLGFYLAQIGIAERSRFVAVGGRVVSALLAFSSVVIAGAVLLRWKPDVAPRTWFYAGLSASALAGILLLALLLGIRIMLGREDTDFERT